MEQLIRRALPETFESKRNPLVIRPPPKNKAMPYRPESELKRPDLKGSFTCGVCYKQFCHAASLNRHRLNFHSGNHHCAICNHMIIRHGIDRVFTCGCCNWAFPDKKELHQHTSSMMKIGVPGPAMPIATNLDIVPGSMIAEKTIKPKSSQQERSPSTPSTSGAAREQTPPLSSNTTTQAATQLPVAAVAIAAAAAASLPTLPLAALPQFNVGGQEIPWNFLLQLAHRKGPDVLKKFYQFYDPKKTDAERVSLLNDIVRAPMTSPQPSTSSETSSSTVNSESSNNSFGIANIINQAREQSMPDEIPESGPEQPDQAESEVENILNSGSPAPENSELLPIAVTMPSLMSMPQEEQQMEAVNLDEPMAGPSISSENTPSNSPCSSLTDSLSGDSLLQGPVVKNTSETERKKRRLERIASHLKHQNAH